MYRHRLTSSSAKCLESTFPVKESEGRGKSGHSGSGPVQFAEKKGLGLLGGRFGTACSKTAVTESSTLF